MGSDGVVHGHTTSVDGNGTVTDTTQNGGDVDSISRGTDGTVTTYHSVENPDGSVTIHWSQTNPDGSVESGTDTFRTAPASEESPAQPGQSPDDPGAEDPDEEPQDGDEGTEEPEEEGRETDDYYGGGDSNEIGPAWNPDGERPTIEGADRPTIPWTDSGPSDGPFELMRMMAMYSDAFTWAGRAADDAGFGRAADASRRAVLARVTPSDDDGDDNSLEDAPIVGPTDVRDLVPPDLANPEDPRTELLGVARSLGAVGFEREISLVQRALSD